MGTPIGGLNERGAWGRLRPVGHAHQGAYRIAGLDEITHGGLPAGRPTLVCGGPGCGKTILAMEFLVRGAMEFNEPGLFVSFEESTDDLHRNFKSFGFDLKSLADKKKLAILHINWSFDIFSLRGEALGKPPQGGRSFFAEPYWG